MQYTSDLCFMCLKKDSTIKDCKNVVKNSIELINFVLPELINEAFGLPFVCAQCYDICKVFHKFKTICIENYDRWKDYSLQLVKTDINFVPDFSDIIIKTEIFEEEEIDVTHIKIEQEYNEENTDSFETSDNCKLEEKEFQNFQISSIISNADNYFNEVSKPEENSLLVVKEKQTKTAKKSKNKINCPSNQCLICKQKFSHLRYLKLHLRKHKIGDKYQCPQCDKQFKQNYLLLEHLKIHLDNKEYECQVCNKKYRLKSTLRSHMKVHEGVEVKCKVCYKVFQREDYLKYHMKLHSDIKEHKCPYCKEAFVYRKYLKRHINRKHSD